MDGLMVYTITLEMGATRAATQSESRLAPSRWVVFGLVSLRNVLKKPLLLVSALLAAECKTSFKAEVRKLSKQKLYFGYIISRWKTVYDKTFCKN